MVIMRRDDPPDPTPAAAPCWRCRGAWRQPLAARTCARPDARRRQGEAEEQERQAQEQQEKEANDALKASAKAKLIAGEPLTEAEADTLVI